MSRIAAPVGDVDHTDAARQHGQRLLARFVEKSFRLELFLQLLERELQRAQAHRLDVAHVNLILAAQFVNAERAANGDVQAVLGAAFQRRATDRESRRSESASARPSA